MRSEREERAFRQFEPMLHKLAWNFHTTTGLESEDLFGEACLAFVKAYRSFDQEKGDLAPRVWVCVSNHLCSYVRHQKTLPKPTFYLDEDLFDIADPKDEVETTENLSAILSKMARDAVHIVRLIESSPLELAEFSRVAYRRSLVERLREEGWSWRRIKSAMNGVRDALRPAV